MSSKNIMTGIVVALALVLVVVVILVKSNVFEKEETTTTEIETIVETEIVVVSETNMFGDVEFLTMVTKYHRPKYSSLHTYPTTTTTTTEESTTEETTTEVQYVELSTVVHVTDENGNRLFEEDGTPVTETVVYTVDANSLTTTTTEYIPETSVVEVTNELGEPVSGMTEIVTLPPPTTTATTTTAPNTRWDTTTSTQKEGGIDIDLGTPQRDDVLAENIIAQINEDRAEQGLAPLTHDTNLKASARTNSMALAVPAVYGESKVNADYTATTKFGGESLYMMVADATRAKAQSADVTKIGVGVVVYDGKYYTTVIYG